MYWLIIVPLMAVTLILVALLILNQRSQEKQTREFLSLIEKTIPILASKDLQGYQAISWTLGNQGKTEPDILDQEAEEAPLDPLDRLISKVSSGEQLTEEEVDALERAATGT